MKTLMNITKKLTLILSVMLLVLLATLAACAPSSEVNVPAQEDAPVDASQAQNPAGEAETIATPIEVSNNDLWLRILSPAEAAIVDIPQVEVTGEALAETILSINDEILLVPADGVFHQMISLEEGANLIEFVASNYNGDEVTLSLIVYYEP